MLADRILGLRYTYEDLKPSKWLLDNQIMYGLRYTYEDLKQYKHRPISNPFLV